MDMKYNSPFTQRVIEELEKARHDAKMSVTELAKKTGIGRNTYFVKLRGESAFNTEDIDKIAAALGLDPVLILQRAASAPTIADEIAEHPDLYDLAANTDPNKTLETETPRD